MLDIYWAERLGGAIVDRAADAIGICLSKDVRVRCVIALDEWLAFLPEGQRDPGRQEHAAYLLYNMLVGAFPWAGGDGRKRQVPRVLAVLRAEYDKFDRERVARAARMAVGPPHCPDCGTNKISDLVKGEYCPRCNNWC